MNKDYKITKNQITTLQSIYKTDKEIALHLQVTPQYICALRKRYQISIIRSKEIKEYRDRDVVLSYKSGTTRFDIMIQFNISYKTVCKIVRRSEK